MLSLLACVATIVLWMRSYRARDADAWRFGSSFWISGNGSLSVFRIVPTGVTETAFYYWQWALIFLTTAAGRVGWWWHQRIKRRLVGPACASCGYDLTRNVSGVCAECGTMILNTPCDA